MQNNLLVMPGKRYESILSEDLVYAEGMDDGDRHIQKPSTSITALFISINKIMDQPYQFLTSLIASFRVTS
jgi:hypothetical protein